MYIFSSDKHFFKYSYKIKPFSKPTVLCQIPYLDSAPSQVITIDSYLLTFCKPYLFCGAKEFCVASFILDSGALCSFKGQ